MLLCMVFASARNVPYTKSGALIDSLAPIPTIQYSCLSNMSLEARFSLSSPQGTLYQNSQHFSATCSIADFVKYLKLTDE